VDLDLEEQARRYTVLEDPQRRAIYQFVRREHGPVTREEVAVDAGVSRSLAAFHLERLLDAGLVTADYARPPGHGGPGSGRPAKRYRVSDVQISIEIPPRRYALAGRLLAMAIEQGGASGSVRDAALRVAGEEGRRLGRDALPRRRRSHDRRATVDVCLSALGFEPTTDEAGHVVLANCPFHGLVDVAPELVCAMNQSLVSGILAGVDASDLEARLEPADGQCCVVLTPRTTNATPK
jgi:predicted ArsR family transcriptional regulator